jgi:hypothetical protein
MNTEAPSAAEALAFIDQSRAKLAAASETPVSRHLAFAGLIALLFASPVLPLEWRFVALLVPLVGVALIVRWDRRRMGMFINGYRAGRTRWVALPVLVVIEALYALSYWLVVERHTNWAAAPLAVVATVVAYVGSVWWCDVFRREMLGSVA